jgi:PAS domain S-box-containing protein
MDPMASSSVDNRSKMIILSTLTFFCIFLEIFMHFLLGISTGYTDFFYVLFVLAGIWFPRKAVILAFCLAAIHISIGYFVLGESLWAPILRSAMFVIITLLVGTLSEELKRTQVNVMENKAVHESEEKYRAFFATSKDVVFITSKDGRFMDFNDETPVFFGYPDREEFETVNARDLYYNPGEREAHTRAIEQSGFVKDYPLDLRKKDGSIIHTLITTIARKDASGTIIGFQGTIKDITEKRRTEEALKAANVRYLSYIDEAVMRLKTPVEVIEQNLTSLIEDINAGDIDSDQILLELKIQVKDMEQIRQNLLNLNKTIVDGYGEISPATKQFLIK